MYNRKRLDNDLTDRIDELECQVTDLKNEQLGLVRSAAFISAVFTLIGMFLLIAIVLSVML